MYFSQFYKTSFPVYERYVVQFLCKLVSLSSFAGTFKMCTKLTKTGTFIPKCRKSFNYIQSSFLSIEYILIQNSHGPVGLQAGMSLETAGLVVYLHLHVYLLFLQIEMNHAILFLYANLNGAKYADFLLLKITAQLLK